MLCSPILHSCESLVALLSDCIVLGCAVVELQYTKNRLPLFFSWLVSLLRTAGKNLWWYTEEQKRITGNRAQETRAGLNGAEEKEICLCILPQQCHQWLLHSPWSTVTKLNTQTWRLWFFFFPLMLYMHAYGTKQLAKTCITVHWQSLHLIFLNK